MQSLELLKARIEGARTLGSIVRTMKILAAVGVRQDAKAREALADYLRTIELGLQVALRHRGQGAVIEAGRAESSPPPTLALVIGSDMGMCGQFNEKIAAFARARLQGTAAPKVSLIAAGERVAMRLEDLDLRPDFVVACPANPSTGVGIAVRQLLARLDAWNEGSPGGLVLAFHNKQAGRGMETECRMTQLLPVDESYLRELRDREWKSRSLPQIRMDSREFLHAYLRGLIRTSLFRIFLDSLESENAARLEAMEAAERHIDEHLGELRASFNEARQDAITSELLDIIAGVEAAGSEAARNRGTADGAQGAIQLSSFWMPS